MYRPRLRDTTLTPWSIYIHTRTYDKLVFPQRTPALRHHWSSGNRKASKKERKFEMERMRRRSRLQTASHIADLIHDDALGRKSALPSCTPTLSTIHGVHLACAFGFGSFAYRRDFVAVYLLSSRGTTCALVVSGVDCADGKALSSSIELLLSSTKSFFFFFSFV